ncbi:MAG: tRNA (adenosine(37)-N6)-threonylcarbamoyltransferase complex dimerization subunit type 1 TsaB [Treponema sp.]|nr:tRNA (adenosine(37)-N6)-threonylcarbamoyltransferase complex dimerization subunit type 1 TsaB [Candidatus Treponema equifaecale]
MKALVIDSAASNMVIAAKNENITATLSLDLGQKQSQKILPAIDYVLKQVDLDSKELDYTALCSGPGTFTGLRLAFSALKAIELAHDVPVYGIPSLDVYAESFKNFDAQIVSVIDAKKDQFFAAIYENGNTVHQAEDTSVEKICGKLNAEKPVIVCGPDAKIFGDLLLNLNPKLNLKYTSSQPLATDSLFSIAESFIEQKKEPLADYDGPVYLRKSEAEIALEKK